MQYTLLNPADSSWPVRVDDVCTRLGAPTKHTLFPPQFLQVTLPKIGGQVVLGEEAGELVCVGFFFPRDVQDGQRAYTMRFHQAGTQAADPQELADAAQALLDCGAITIYDPHAPQHYEATHHTVGAFDIGVPDEREAIAIREMQRQIWGATDGFLYPSDLHSVDFRPGTSLVARADGQPVAFLFGFFRFGPVGTAPAWSANHRSDLRIESQTLGVLPEFRRTGLGFLLKRRQAELALESGIDIVHWTVDPLQFPNGVLNFGKLGGVAFDFYAGYYPFRNALNQLPASRFSITWLLRTHMVGARLAKKQPVPVLDDFSRLQVLNKASVAFTKPVDSPTVAVEIPADWTDLQQRNLSEAAQWRTTTDALLGKYIGIEPKQYVITDVALSNERRFLVGRRFDGDVSVLDKGWQ